MNFKINRTLLTGIVVLVALGIFVAWKYSAPNSFRCPNDYATAEAYVTGVTEWAKGELMNSPNMTKEDLLNVRQKLFQEHACAPSRWSTVPDGL